MTMSGHTSPYWLVSVWWLDLVTSIQTQHPKFTPGLQLRSAMTCQALFPALAVIIQRKASIEAPSSCPAPAACLPLASAARFPENVRILRGSRDLRNNSPLYLHQRSQSHCFCNIRVHVVLFNSGILKKLHLVQYVEAAWLFISYHVSLPKIPATGRTHLFSTR